MTFRERYLAAVVKLIGRPVLWRGKGLIAYDCSGTVTASLRLIGGPDLTLIDNAQALHDHSRMLRSELGPAEAPLPGDLVFCGTSPLGIEHVMTVDETGLGCISADGATSALDPAKLGFERALALTLANEHNRVRRHADYRWRKDFFSVHRNTFVDDLDHVSH